MNEQANFSQFKILFWNQVKEKFYVDLRQVRKSDLFIKF